MATAPRPRTLSQALLPIAFAIFALFSASAHAQAVTCFDAGGTVTAAGNYIPTMNCTESPNVPQRPNARPPEPDVWGALAVSPALGWGTSINQKTQAAAEAEALRHCKTVSPKSPCKLAVAVADVCVSLSFSIADHIYAVGGPIGSVDVADGNATLHCQRGGGKTCVIATSFCADGIRHGARPYTHFNNGYPLWTP